MVAAYKRIHAQIRLLADEGVHGPELQDKELAERVGVHHRTISKLRQRFKPWLRDMWCIPPQQEAAFVCAMEHVLAVYKRPTDARFPVVCMDESAPFIGWRRIEVAANHAAQEWARGVRKLVEEDFPDAKRITLVMDNLSTHTGASLYKAFESQVARRL